MADGPGPRVVARDLVAGYGATARTPPVLRGLELDVRPRVVTAVVGPNGAGKSTLFRCLLGFLPPRAGQVAIGGRPPRAYRARNGFGYLPESIHLPRGWTAGEWVRSAARLKGGSGRTAVAGVAGMMEALGVEAYRATRLEHLSRGNARRVALAWVLTGGPAVVLLDEPLAALDASARIGVRDAVDRLRRAGTTVLVATHELHEVPRLADRALVLTAGRIVATLDRPDPTEMEARILEAGGADR